MENKIKEDHEDVGENENKIDTVKRKTDAEEDGVQITNIQNVLENDDHLNTIAKKLENRNG